MTKNEFLDKLMHKLEGLPAEDIGRSMQFYGEMIDDRIDCGATEEEAVAAMGSVEDIAAQILSESPIPPAIIVEERKKRRLTPLEIILLILGFPLWFSLLAAAVAVIASVVISLWAVAVSLYAVVLALGISAIACLISMLTLFFAGKGIPAVAFCGAGLICVGLGILLFLGTGYAVKGLVWLTKNSFVWLKRR